MRHGLTLAETLNSRPVSGWIDAVFGRETLNLYFPVSR
jgi:hypothetical protein